MSTTASRLLSLFALCCACSLVSRTLADEADDRFAVASDHYAAKRWNQAFEEFRVVAHDYPGHAKRGKAMFFEGEALVQMGRYAEAYSLFVDLLAEQPTGPLAKQTLFRAAETAVISGKTAEAVVRLSQFQLQFPSDKLNAEILMLRGQLALHTGDTAGAERSYRESLDRFGSAPTADECRLRLAHIFELEKRPDDAVQLIREVADHDQSPWSETALLQLAARELAASMPQAAFELYGAVEKRFPNSPLLPQTHLGCGRALYQLGRYTDAENVLTPLVTNKELSNDARYWIAQAQKAQKLQKPAVEAPRTSVESVQTTAPKAGPAASSRRDPKASVAATPGLAQPTASAPSSAAPAPSDSDAADKSATTSSIAIRPSVTAAPTEPLKTDKAIIDSKSPVGADPKAVVMESVPANVTAQRDEQNRRRSAVIRYQAADTMIRAGDFGRAISTLQMGDNSGDDPRSLANRYLLSIALQGAGRNDEALKTLDDLSRALETKLAAVSTSRSADDSAQSAATQSRSGSDLAALRSLNDNVQLAIATSLVAQEKYSEAIKPLQIYLATPRTDLGGQRARSALAICLAHCHRAEEARKMLAELKEIYPASNLIASTTQHVAEASYDGKEYAVAADLFSTLAADENPPELVASGLAGLGWCRFQSGENEAADQGFARFLERFPTDPRAADVALARGQALERQGKDEPALAVVRQALKRYPQAKQLPQLLLAAARLCDRLQHDDEAVLLYQRLLREFPKSQDVDAVLYGLAWSLRDLGRGDDSEKTFRRLQHEHPESRFWGDASYRLAERASQRGDRDAATALLEPLFDSDAPAPVREHALYLHAQLSITAEKWTAAEPSLALISHDFPDGALRLPAEFWLAEVAFRRGDFPLAQQRFDALGSRIPDHSEAWTAIIPLRRAQILAQDKQWAKARALAETIAPAYPVFDQQFEADYIIGRCFAAAADYDAARTAFLRVVRSNAGGKTETAAMAQWMIGESYFHQDEYAQALREYLRVEVVYPFSRWQAASLLQAAKCYEHLDQPKEAAELYARVLQSYPQTEFVAEASKRLMETTRK